MFSGNDSSRGYNPVGHHQTGMSGRLRRYLIGAGVLIALFVVWSFAGSSSSGKQFKVATWNIAAINNNPFEYWITHDDPAYNNMMDAVQNFIENPGDSDVKVSEVFTQDMFDTLVSHMQEVGWDGIEETKAQWQNNFKDRKIISGFMKDSELGLKRLASMPDRTTNTVGLASGSFAYRPTVINCYNKKISDLQSWFRQWVFFMFKEKLKLTDDDGNTVEKSGYELLVPIKRSKYPALTEAEEKISIPLQTMCGAIFDSILVKIVMEVEADKWQDLRSEMCEALNLKKNDHTLGILSASYGDHDIVFLEEAANTLIELARADSSISDTFSVLAPAALSKRNQNSAMLLRKSVFDISTVVEVTEQVESELPAAAPVAVGDIFSITVSDVDGVKYMLSAFHGDTNGLATIPVVTAVHNTKTAHFRDHVLIFGLDANTYEHAKPGKTQDVLEFADAYVKLGLTSCWGDTPDPTDHTTYSARTFLQPQLNKAAKKDELVEKGDVNPKDFILFYPYDLSVTSVGKDNTGKKKFIENMVFPTLDFPSDHGILRSVLVSKTA